MDPKDLQRKVKKYLIKNGTGAKGRLAEAAGVSSRLIDEVALNGHLPKPSNVYRLLVAMGEPVPEELFAVS